MAKKGAADEDGDGPPATWNGVHLADSGSLGLWRSWHEQNIAPEMISVMAFDKNNVLDRMCWDHAGKLICVRTHNNALAVVSRSTKRWGEVFDTKLEWHLAARAADINIFTETIHHAGPVRVFRLDGMLANTICINGDKGDVAALIGLPMLLFDDREENLDDVLKKGISGCEGVLVRRRSASQRRVPRHWREHLINDSQQWIHRGIRFVEQFPLRKPQRENQIEEACFPRQSIKRSAWKQCPAHGVTGVL